MNKLTPTVGGAKVAHRSATAGVTRCDGPARQPDSDGLGVYVHFPWCRAKCPYCDFLSLPTDPGEIPHERYADAVVAELHRWLAGGPRPPLRSVFFGGGTPSLWKPSALGRVLKQILSAFASAEGGVEVTAECNPTRFDVERARALAEQGVNRLSLGIQSLSEQRLRFLGRWHSPEEGLSAAQAALSVGGLRVSSDLIYGVHEQTPEEAADEAARLADLGLTHVSAYALTIEPQTAFGARARKGTLPQARDASVAESFVAVREALGARGFGHYEVSNYARPGAECDHNLGYWLGRDYLGLGCGAFGTVAPNRGLLSGESQRLRYRNAPQVERYMTLALEGRGAPTALHALREPLDPDTLMSEHIMLGLRMARGLRIEALERAAGCAFWTLERRRTAGKLLERGLLEPLPGEAEGLRIPAEQWLLADGIIAELM